MINVTSQTFLLSFTGSLSLSVTFQRWDDAVEQNVCPVNLTCWTFYFFWKTCWTLLPRIGELSMTLLISDSISLKEKVVAHPSSLNYRMINPISPSQRCADISFSLYNCEKKCGMKQEHNGRKTRTQLTVIARV